MKLFALLFLVGYASASFYDALDEAADEIVRDFMLGMENAPSLKDALQLSDTQAADEVEDIIKTELGKKLKETLDHLLEKIKEAIDHGKSVKEDLVSKVKEVREKLKDLHIEIGEKGKELLQKIKDKAKEFLKKLLEKLGIGGNSSERSLDELRAIQASFSIREMLKKLKQSILDMIDKDALKDKIESLFGKGNELADQLLKILKEKGENYKQKLLDLVDRLLGEKDTESSKRSLSEMWQKVKDYFDNLKIDLKEKYLKFGEWVKEVLGKGLDSAKSKLENLKQIAKEVIEHVKDIKKDVAAQALEVLRPYKEDLGSLYEQLKEAVKEILAKKE